MSPRWGAANPPNHQIGSTKGGEKAWEVERSPSEKAMTGRMTSQFSHPILQIPYDIMGSPLTPEEELRNIMSMQSTIPLTPEEEAESKKPKALWNAVPRPPPGPNGTFGKPDLAGVRWRALKSGEGTLPYPRIPTR